MQGIFQKENTDKALKYGIYRHLPTYEKIIRNLVSFYYKKIKELMNDYQDLILEELEQECQEKINENMAYVLQCAFVF